MTVMTPDDFLAEIEELPQLKAFPTAASRLMAEIEDPAVTPKRISEIVQCDPVLAGKLLRVANSPLYGYAGQIRTVEQAVVILGMRSTRDLVLTVTGSAVFADGETALEERQALWHHSLLVATISRELSGQCNANAEEAFLSGIFHDVGKLVMYDLAADTYLDAPKGADSERLEWEVANLGIDHSELGMDCADQWGLPSDIAEAIGCHHGRGQDDALSRCVAVSNAVANAWNPLTEMEPDIVSGQLANWGVQLSESELNAFGESVTAQYQSVMETLASS